MPQQKQCPCVIVIAIFVACVFFAVVCKVTKLARDAEVGAFEYELLESWFRHQPSLRADIAEAYADEKITRAEYWHLDALVDKARAEDDLRSFRIAVKEYNREQRRRHEIQLDDE